jgi:hypothetical protein
MTVMDEAPTRNGSVVHSQRTASPDAAIIPAASPTATPGATGARPSGVFPGQRPERPARRGSQVFRSHLLRVTVPAEVESGWDAGGFEVGVSCHSPAASVGHADAGRACSTRGCRAARPRPSRAHNNSNEMSARADADRRCFRNILLQHVFRHDLVRVACRQLRAARHGDAGGRHRTRSRPAVSGTMHVPKEPRIQRLHLSVRADGP